MVAVDGRMHVFCLINLIKRAQWGENNCTDSDKNIRCEIKDRHSLTNDTLAWFLCLNIHPKHAEVFKSVQMLANVWTAQALKKKVYW